MPKPPRPSVWVFATTEKVHHKNLNSQADNGCHSHLTNKKLALQGEGFHYKEVLEQGEGGFMDTKYKEGQGD